jgi:hypothetical protein
MKTMNDPERLSDKDIEEMFDATAERLEEIEQLFPSKGDVLYYLSGALPLILMIASTALYAVADSREQKDSASGLMLVALLGVIIYKIDRVFEYVMMRLDMYDLNIIEEGMNNEQPSED